MSLTGNTKKVLSRLRDPSSPYFIYSSNVVNPLSGNDVLAKGSPADNFVTALDGNLIILSSKPAAASSNDTILSADIDSTDKWYQWFAQLDTATPFAGTLSVFLQANDQSIDHFSIELKNPCDVVFSSSTTALTSAFGPPPLLDNESGSTISVPGLDQLGKMLYCGLDTTNSTTQTVTMSQAFSFVGISSMIQYLPAVLRSLSATFNPTKAASNHNGLWFSPIDNYRTVVRLRFELLDVTTFAGYFTSVISGLKITSVDLVCKKNVVRSPSNSGVIAVDNGSAVYVISCSVTDPSSSNTANLMAAIEFAEATTTMTLITTVSNSFTTLLNWLGANIGINTLTTDITSLLSASGSLDHDFNIRRLKLVLDTSDAVNGPTLSSISVDMEISISALGTSSTPAVFLLTYGWMKGVGDLGFLQGQLWTTSDTSTPNDLNPFYEPWESLQPLKTPAASITLSHIIPNQNIPMPDNLPTQISKASIFLSQKAFQISAIIDSTGSMAPGALPQPYLGQVTLSAFYTGTDSSNFTASIGISAGLQPSSTSSVHDLATLTGLLTYTYDGKSKTSAWELRGTLDGLYASSLYQFFTSDSVDHVMPLIDSIEIGTLDVDYKYQGSVGSTFTLTGALFIASLELDLTFSSSPGSFDFSAKLSSTQQTETLGAMMASILGDPQLEIPDFLANMTFGGQDSKDSIVISVSRKPAASSVTKSNTRADAAGDPATVFQFIATITIKSLEITFAQYHNSGWLKTVPSKRMVKLTLSNFGAVKIPLVGDIDQPFDEMYYLWVQDTTSQNVSKVPGFTRQEIADMNQSLADPLIYKDTFKDKQDTDTVAAAGSHFALVLNETGSGAVCVLDYNFGKPVQQKKPPLVAASGSKVANASATSLGSQADATPGDENSAQAPLKKKTGPLSISSVALKLTGNDLAVKFDAKFDLGPLSFSLLGFSIDLAIKSLNDWTIGAGLEGLSVAFDQAPLTIAGIIRHGTTGSIDYYAGGLIVGFTPYLFEAAGFYGSTSANGQPFTSVFVFARLDGPLISLEFAEISGVTGGIGYNSEVRIPAIADVSSFPFIGTQVLDGKSDDALDALQALVDPGAGGWFSPQNNIFWAAAGLKVDAFQMLSIDAVLLVQFGDSIKLGLFAVAVGDVPDSLSSEKFAHIELGISVVVDFAYGTLKAESQLTPRSYILAPDCHLTGGSALYYWFDAPHADKANIGNFVFTVGGYHQAFAVPDGWPNPPRLGVSWSVSDSISITGEAYFAITPQVCMGGGRLHATYSAGPIDAFFDAFADFLINYKPFHFTAQGGISVGVRYNLDLLFVHTHISVEIGATLTLWGPPLAGRVHVDFWITSFDVNFGQSQASIDKIDLEAFYLLVLQSSQNKGGNSSVDVAHDATAVIAAAKDSNPPIIRPDNEAHSFLAQSGLLNNNEQAQQTPNTAWTVRGGTFSFLVDCTMAVDSVTCGKLPDGSTNQIKHTQPRIYSRPMQLDKSLDSIMTITISDGSVSDGVWKLKKSLKSVPRALWDQYSTSTDPSGGQNNLPSLLSSFNSGVPLMMGVTLSAPPATVSDDKLQPFSIADANLVNLTANPFPQGTAASTAWLAGTPASGAQQWTDVHDQWQTPTYSKTDPNAQSEFVAGWIAAFLLSDPDGSMQAHTGMPPNLGNDFNNLYVAAPMTTV